MSEIARLVARRSASAWDLVLLNRASIFEHYVDAAVVTALLLDLADSGASDLARSEKMRPAAGLQVNVSNFQQSHFSGVSRWFDLHRPYEFGLSVQLLVGDPARSHGMILFDQAIQIVLEALLVRYFLHVEVEATAFARDVAAGDPEREHGAEKVQTGVCMRM